MVALSGAKQFVFNNMVASVQVAENLPFVFNNMVASTPPKKEFLLFPGRPEGFAPGAPTCIAPTRRAGISDPPESL
jgi:hypothetical protein